MPSVIEKVFGYFGYFRDSRSVIAKAASVRATIFAINQAMYDNTIYEQRHCGGHLESILEGCGRKSGRIVGYFNPAKEIVETYVQNVLRGSWNDELVPVQPDSQDPLDDTLKAELTAVWRDSNLDTDKSSIVRSAANFGTVGLKVCRAPNSERVIIQECDPAWIFDVERDTMKNVTGVVLKYRRSVNYGSPLQPAYEDVEVIEQLNKESFSQMIDGKEQILDDDRRNTFGFCPFVLLPHKANKTAFGDWAYRGSEQQIHEINLDLTEEGQSVSRHRKPHWFFTAGGRKPESIPLDDGQRALYVQSLSGTPPPAIEAIVPKIDHGSALKFNLDLRDQVRGRQPELNINDVQLFANVSGDTIEQVLKPAESVILGVRPNYDHAFIRAMQMAVSIRIDLGLSQGIASSGDSAFKDNKLAFQFAKRPALPQTAGQQMQQAQAETARQSNRFDVAAKASKIGVDSAEQLKIAGYTDKEAKEIQQRKATVDKTEPAIM